MAKMVDVNTMWKCETCFHYRTGECSPAIWCENGEVYRPDYNKLAFVEAEPVKHGKWVHTKIETAFRCIPVKGELVDIPVYCVTESKCSLCDHSTDKIGNYCPNCGARMDGE